MKKTFRGVQTQEALENFPFHLPVVSLELMYAMAEVKEAAALANADAGSLPVPIAKAIQTACQEIRQGKWDELFVTCSVQGGAGTSMNMNVNEVVAQRATELLETTAKPVKVHPNDHVNLSQSTNDANPSALRIVCVRRAMLLQKVCEELVVVLKKHAQKYAKVKKLARTHLQDAVPTTIGQEFASYEAVIARDLRRIEDCVPFLQEMNLGGTAIGDRTNASPAYCKAVYQHLQKITGLKLKPAANLMSLTSSTTDFAALSAAITLLFADLSKMATDLRVLASGPRGGIGEITLAQLQPGSSIMPGKVNPVAAESINQSFYFIAGKNQSILQASEAACLELAVMFPIVAEGLLAQMQLACAVIPVFREKGLQPLVVNAARCAELLERSSAYATLLTPKLGYDVVSAAVKTTIAENSSLREVIVGGGKLSDEEFDKLVGVAVH